MIISKVIDLDIWSVENRKQFGKVLVERTSIDSWDAIIDGTIRKSGTDIQIAKFVRDNG